MNALAFMHVKAMTKFTEAGSRTQGPEDLSGFAKFKVLLTGVTLPRPENARTPGDMGLSFQTHHYPNPRRETLEAWHIPAADDEILILLFHGYGASKASLLPMAQQLNALGWGTFLVDFFGSGGSTGDRTTIGFLESEDVTASFKYAQKHWPNALIVLYGQSMGGAATLRSIAVDGISPDAVVLEATYDTMLSTVQNRFAAMRIPSTPLAHLLVFWGGWQAGFNAFEHNPADYAKFVNSPTLVFHGKHDLRVTRDQAQAVYNRLGGWKRFSEYPLAGHEAVMKTDLKRWREDIKELIDKVKILKRFNTSAKLERLTDQNRRRRMVI